MNLCDIYPLCTQQNSSLGGFISSLVNPAFTIAGILLIFYFITAAIKWMTSGGDKQALADARAMFTHTIVGFLLLMLLFLIVQLLPKLGIGVIIAQ